MTLLSCRLRWYAYETGRLLRRHWKALFLALMLLSPAMMPVLEQTRILGAPVLTLLSPEHSTIWRFGWLILLQACGVLWLLIQRNAVSGGAFMDYVHSLPVRPGQLRRTHLALLLLADTPLLLPVLAATVFLAAQPHRVIPCLSVLDLVLSTLCAQLLVLERAWRHLPRVLLANLLLIVSISAGLGANIPLSLLMLALCALICLVTIVASPATPNVARRWDWSGIPARMSGRSSERHGLCLLQARFPLLHLSMRILFDRYRSASLVRGLVQLLLASGAILLMQLWHFDSRALPLTLMVQALMALVSAGAYRDLQREHDHAAPYRLTLPIPAWALARADSLTVLLGCLPFALAMTGAVAVHRAAAGALLSLSSVLLLAPLLVALRVPLVHAPRQALVWACLLAGMWSVLVWQLLL